MTATAAHSRHPFQAVAVVTTASYGIGILTAWAQTVLPYSLLSLANSANGWTLVIVVLLLAVRADVRLAAALGAASSVLLMSGYTAGLALHGQPYNPLLWIFSSAVIGPFIGIATTWLRDSGIRPALGTAALAGITIGESLYGLTYVNETTSPVYWTISALAGSAFLIAMLVRRIRGRLPLSVAVLGTAAVVAVFIPVYGTVGTYA